MAVTAAACTVSAEMTKVVAIVDQHNMDLDGYPFASDIEEDEAVIEDK